MDHLHIALIMDGNGRWAIERNLPRFRGHQAGTENMIELLNKLPSFVSIVTLYAFSSENWSRSIAELFHLFKIAKQFFQIHLQKLIDMGFKIHIIGDMSILPKQLIKILQLSIKASEKGVKLLNLAINYSGQEDISQAVEKANKTNTDFKQHLALNNMKEPDILIRTGGHQRLSNFMLWQLAYTELFFTNTFWPDFKIEELNQILQSFQNRNRQYGFV